jgi:NIMA (never in mitosis gene a)-related kinase
MPYADYQKVKEIGSGSFGHAYLVQAGDRPAVLKEVDMSRMGQSEQLRAEGEVRVLQKLKHPYIVRYWESFIHKTKLCIVMDFCDGGDLSKCITSHRFHRSKIPEAQVLRWFTQMSLAMKHMHDDKHILHRDIKPQNIFLVKKEGGPMGSVKLADFGISKILPSVNAKARTMAGTPYYLSPEMCKKEAYACPSDMWALGCVLFELCSLQVPFDAQDMNQLLDRIRRAPIPKVSSYSLQVAELVAALLERSPDRRLSASGVLQRPRIQQEIQAMLSDERKHKDRKDEIKEVPACHRSPPAAQSLNIAQDRHRSPHKDLNGRAGSPSPAKHGRDPSPHRAAAKEVIQPLRHASPRRQKDAHAPSPAPRRLFGA